MRYTRGVCPDCLAGDFLRHICTFPSVLFGTISNTAANKFFIIDAYLALSNDRSIFFDQFITDSRRRLPFYRFIHDSCEEQCSWRTGEKNVTQTHFDPFNANPTGGHRKWSLFFDGALSMVPNYNACKRYFVSVRACQCRLRITMTTKHFSMRQKCE